MTFNQERQTVNNQVNIGDPNANYTQGKVSDSQPVPDPADLCQQILQAVTDRGYREGWDDNKFFLRQLLKILDEFSELEHLVTIWQPGTSALFSAANAIGGQCGKVFKMKDQNLFSCSLDDIDEIKSELCDVIIPAMVALAVLGGTTEDIRAKALSDVERGTDYEGDNR